MKNSQNLSTKFTNNDISSAEKALEPFVAKPGEKVIPLSEFKSYPDEDIWPILNSISQQYISEDIDAKAYVEKPYLLDH